MRCGQDETRSQSSASRIFLHIGGEHWLPCLALPISLPPKAVTLYGCSNNLVFLLANRGHFFCSEDADRIRIDTLSESDVVRLEALLGRSPSGAGAAETSSDEEDAEEGEREERDEDS